ncbi:MAG: ferritin family protein [Candidatus Margulisbacteria bacterium]|nr:ferritin family protein [Candidatus Margulisiibacteriota bacterium]MBU1022370.1 ferritin family protein [Candidatus Margulisiibacteriota bacterium]MBU1729078.1 ferritin family protein [Candidatus Margulisiibacteriota bacterium]MBU1954501.1 ferritin family protein [Candidatus Margulisiibacteriota bacterium]
MPSIEDVKPLLIALKGEQEALELYTRMKQRSTNPTGKEMFENLIAEEKKHARIIEERLSTIKAPVDTSQISEKVSSLSEVDFEDPALSDLEIIKLAIEDENAAFAFYMKASEESTDPEEIAIFTLLARDEKGHIELLKKRLQG